ncbi:hypothetical protein ALC60_11106 [Trachymyrmex zeteki]|uniref:Uncharacterized protein n=1 Tax=Mycetomoellerius zeteki TaxID=64791 RepID=A0A151WPM3_9HYME|nr:hypothetical protein ALC60_11106 [Trachymyrmex zeteki]
MQATKFSIRVHTESKFSDTNFFFYVSRIHYSVATVKFIDFTLCTHSKSMHFESLKHFSSCLLISIAASDCLPPSKCCAAKGASSTFMRIMPSLGRDAFGCCISHDTCAMALQKDFFFQSFICSLKIICRDIIK